MTPEFALGLIMASIVAGIALWLWTGKPDDEDWPDDQRFI